MLGLLLSEFVNMVETRFGAPVADAILFATEVPDGHDDERLHPYPAVQVKVLIDALSCRVGQAPRDLLQALAGRVISRIRLVNPEVFALHADLFGQIKASEDVVLASYDIDELAVEEMALLFGERAAAESLVGGLLSDLDRCAGHPAPTRLHRMRSGLMQVRQLMR